MDLVKSAFEKPRVCDERFQKKYKWKYWLGSQVRLMVE